MAKTEPQHQGLVWNGADYPRVPAGRYQAVATRYQGPEWCRQYNRWSLMIEFELLCEDSLVCAFFNMGSDPKAAKVTRRGRFFGAWTLANGELPRKHQKLSPEAFLEGQVFTVEVGDSPQRPDGTPKQDAEVYSRVIEIIAVETRACDRSSERVPEDVLLSEPFNHPLSHSLLCGR